MNICRGRGSGDDNLHNRKHTKSNHISGLKENKGNCEEVRR